MRHMLLPLLCGLIFSLAGCMQSDNDPVSDGTTQSTDPRHSNTLWSPLSAHDRSQLRLRMLALRTYEECAQLVTETTRTVRARDLQKMDIEVIDSPDYTVAAAPPEHVDICLRLKAAGMFR